MFSSSAWMNENDAFLLSIIQGPAAAGAHISGWAQYLRRVTTYGCMVFGVCNNNVVTDEDAARISEKDWLKCYSHLVRTYGLTRTGCYLSTAGLLMMLGKNDKEVAHLSGMGEVVKKICNPLACEIVENPRTQKNSDMLSGKFRQGTTILITDLAHHIGTSSGRHDVGMGLHDMGWNIDLFKIHEAEPALPIAKFHETVNNVIEYLSKDLNDLGLVTVHVWLSLQFLHDAKPPHNVVVPPSFQKEFIQCVTELDQASSRPVIVARLAVELTESLKREGAMVTTDQRMWRSMHSQFGSQFSPLRATRKGTLGKNAIWSVIEKNLFRQRVFLMCATNREHVSTLNEGAYRPKHSGVNAEMLADVTGSTQVFRIASGDMTPDDYAKGDVPIYQKGTSTTGSTTTRFNKDKRHKAQWIEPIVRSHELEPEESFNCYWFPVFPDSVDFLCDHCRAAKTMDEIEIAQYKPASCINCSANTQDHYRKSAPTLGARKSVLLLAARLKVAFKNCGLDKLDIGKNFQKWLVFAAASVISNKQLKYGEELMKSLFHMGGVRIPYNQAKEIFKNGRGKQFSIYRERVYDKGPGKWILVFRVTKDCGNFAYKDFFEQVAVPEMKERNEIFAFTRATAEKVGDIIEFWLGVLDIASMAKGVIDVFDDHIDPTEFLNGLEKALTAFGSMARTTFTTHDKRRGSFDCTLQPSEAEEVMTIINTIPDYDSLTEFDCMTPWKKQQVIDKFRKKYNIADDVDMGDEADVGDEADDELGQGLSAPPDEEEAKEPNEADTEAARASERSGKQYLLDALGNFLTASEEVNVCIFCGSTKHTHDECEDPKRADLKKALDAIRTALEGESSGSDVEMEQEGEKKKDGSGETDESKGPAEPDQARTGEYHWYDDSRLMSEVGDLDEAGRFCIDGCDIVSEGPKTRYDLDDVIRDAIMRGGGDVWKVPDFLAAYTDKNTRKPMYQRVEAPMDGFLKIVPNTGCHFFNYKFYSGVEYGIDYRFGQQKLSNYEDEVSGALNRILRHQVGKASENQSLVCDDAGWVPIDDVLQCEGIWRCERLRWPHTFLVPFGKEKTTDNWDEQEATFRLQTLFKIMFYCARYSRRVREQVLACGIFPDIDRSSDTCRCNGVSTVTFIPEEGLLLYPVAVRAPTGHGDARGSNDVELRSTLLSHPIAPSTVVSMPVCFHITSSRHLRSIWKEGLIPGGLSASARIFTVFNPYVPWDPRSWKVTKSVDTRKGGFVCLYIPMEILMNEFNGSLTDSGQVVTDQIIPFSKIKGGWIQNSKTAWERLIVKSGDDQVVRIGRVQSSIVATKESLLRLAKQCLSVEEQPFDELTMDAMSLISKFENHMIPEGGKEQYEGRIRLVDYILEKKPVTESGCRYCPHCLKETPTVFAICLACWTALESHGLSHTESSRKRTKRRPRNGRSMRKSAGTRRPSSKTLSTRHKKMLPKTTIMGLTLVRLIMTKATRK